MSARKCLVGVLGMTVVLFRGVTSLVFALEVGPAIPTILPDPQPRERVTYISPDAMHMLTTYWPFPGYTGSRTWDSQQGGWSNSEQILPAGSDYAYLSPDGNTIYYTSADPIGGPGEIYRSTWDEDGRSWVGRDRVPNVDSPGADHAPVLNGGQIYWSGRDRQDIWVADYDSANKAFLNPREVDGVKSEWRDTAPWVSADGRLLVFSSNREGGFGDFDLWYATWDDTLDWTNITNMGPNVNTASGEYWPRMADDASILFFTRSDSTTYTILQADVNSLPIPDAGPDQTVECTGELTEVLLDGSGSFDPDGDPLEYEWSALEGVIIEDPYAETTRAWFPHGTKTVTLTVQDGINDPVDDQAVIAVQDSTDPGVDSCWAEPSKLWPPDHRMVDVAIFVITSDGCTDPQDLVVACKVSSNEPDDGTGDGAFTGDVDGQDGFTSDVPIGVLLYDPDLECFVGTVSLRAERDGSQSGRTYSIMCEVVDEAGNSTEADCVVVVPHDRRKQK